MKYLKKIGAAMMAVVLASCLITPAFAVEGQGRNTPHANAAPRTTTSKNVTDNEGNRFYVVGQNVGGGTSADIETAFSTSYYYGGTPADRTRVDGYTKSVSVSGTVSLLGGGKSPLSSSKNLTGASGVAADGRYDYLYAVTGVTATHSFSCNGGSTQFTTFA